MTDAPLALLAVANRIDTLEAVATRMEANPPEGEAAFADAVRALLLCGVQGIEIGRMLGVESSCITRWTKRGATPHPVGRRTYARHLPAIARKAIATLREEYGMPAPAPLVLAEAA